MSSLLHQHRFGLAPEVLLSLVLMKRKGVDLETTGDVSGIEVLRAVHGSGVPQQGA